MLQRKLLAHLLAWKNTANKKPLLLRGARQVGKTTIAQQLGKHYKNFVYLNLEKSNDAKFFTLYGDDVATIVNAICLAHNIEEPFLLFIDEIQEVPQAIVLLRYFYESYPHIDVIAAGSLLEFALGDVPSFPVGRVVQLPVHPLDFEEFLMALGETQAIKMYNTIPTPLYAHETLLSLFNEYILVGGMPEVVQAYVNNGKQIQLLRKIYSSIWDNYQADVEKYGKNNNEKQVLRHIITTSSSIRDRITFNGFGSSSYGSREVSESFRKLQMAGIFKLIYPTTALEPPLVPNIKRKPKLQFLDTGLLNYAGNLHQELLGVKDFNGIYRGYIVNHILFQEIISKYDTMNEVPAFWTRESTTANAEIDVVVQYKNKIIPIEIKSGAKGGLKSLHEYMDRCNHIFSFRLLANNFSIEKSTTKTGKEFIIVNLPYYCIGKMQEWIAYVENANKH
jgi:uncharacterized protein